MEGLVWAWIAGHPDMSLTVVGWAGRGVPLVLVGAAADAVEEATAARMALAQQLVSSPLQGVELDGRLQVRATNAHAAT